MTGRTELDGKKYQPDCAYGPGRQAREHFVLQPPAPDTHRCMALLCPCTAEQKSDVLVTRRRSSLRTE